MIFETLSTFDVVMLGLRWLSTNQVVVDYHKKILTLNSPTESANRRNQDLVKKGYLPYR